MPPSSTPPRAPISDEIIFAVSKLVDDSQTTTREPSHSELEFQINRLHLTGGDPRQSQGATVGKAKRVRATLSWAFEQSPNNAELFIAALISLVKARGGFRETSPNFVGHEAIADAMDAFKSEGFHLTMEGDLNPSTLDSLSGTALTNALEAYVRRARRGSEDAALLVGTAKDLLEATAAHIIHERFGQYPQQANFPTLLGQAFTVLSLATPLTPPQAGELPQRKLERSLYEAGCSVNALRNRQGTGHGRPWIPTVTQEEAKAAIQLIGIISAFLLTTHKTRP